MGTSRNVMNHAPPCQPSPSRQSILSLRQVVLVRKMLLVPLLACLFASLGTEIAAWSQPSIVSQPPKKWLGGREEAK